MKEVDRLAAVVARIDEDAAVVPRGAYIRTPLGEAVINKSFQGEWFRTPKTIASVCDVHRAVSHRPGPS